MKYKVWLETWDTWLLVVEANGAEQAEEIALNGDHVKDGQFLSGDVEVTLVEEVND